MGFVSGRSRQTETTEIAAPTAVLPAVGTPPTQASRAALALDTAVSMMSNLDTECRQRETQAATNGWSLARPISGNRRALRMSSNRFGVVVEQRGSPSRAPVDTAGRWAADYVRARELTLPPSGL